MTMQWLLPLNQYQVQQQNSFFFTVTTAGVSQPEHIFSQVAYEGFQPLQDGFKWTRVHEDYEEEEENKKTHTTNTQD
jgi:hypothetical protein